MIYFLVDPTPGDTRVKIGYSSTPEGVVQRFHQHRSSNTRLEFYCAIDGDRTHEKRLHQHFANAKIDTAGGSVETFQLTDDLRDYLEWLGEQAWSACSLDEVTDPFAHFEVPVMWAHQDYRSVTNRSVDDGALFDFETVCRPWIGDVRAPLAAEARGSKAVRDSNEWYTPQAYVEAARDVMGSIDLDPASNYYANRWIRAERLYTKNHDGLAPSNAWAGNVWLNPPYGGLQVPFLERLVNEYEQGNITQAVACINGYRYDAKWFRPIWNYDLCFAARRVRFIGGASEHGPKDELDNSPANGTVFVYLGPDSCRFAERFSQFGFVVRDVVPWRGEYEPLLTA